MEQISHQDSPQLIEESSDSSSVGAPVDFRVLLPSDHVERGPLPLVLHLHGARSSSASLELARPLYEEAWRRGDLPPAIVACPSTPTEGGFYIDREGAGWETLVAREFPAYLAATYGQPSSTALIGASMGGYGALKVAFDSPEDFAAVAALSPAIFPGETPQEVPKRNLPSVLGQLHQEMAGEAGDMSAYLSNSVHARARANAGRIRASALPIFLDCGAEDEFLLHDGTEYLHRLLRELEITHDYRLVEGAGHLGPEVEARTAAAIRFVGQALIWRSASS